MEDQLESTVARITEANETLAEELATLRSSYSRYVEVAGQAAKERDEELAELREQLVFYERMFTEHGNDLKGKDDQHA